MIAVLGSVALASALGSLHCAAMCGPLTSLYLEPATMRPGTASARLRWTAPLAFAQHGRPGPCSMSLLSAYSLSPWGSRQECSC